MASTYVARHLLRIDGRVREPGELVPEAATWPRLQSSITTGRVRPTDVPDAVFVAAVRTYCPRLSAVLARLNNIDFSAYPVEDAPSLAARKPGPPEPETDPSLIPAPHQPDPDQLEEGEATVVHPQVQDELKPPAAKPAAKKTAAKAPAKKAPTKKV